MKRKYEMNSTEKNATQDKLNVNNYRNTLISHFFENDDLALPKFDDLDITYRDWNFLKNLDESILELRNDIESRKNQIRGYGISLIKDKTGFGLDLILLPPNINFPLETSFVFEFKELLDQWCDNELLFEMRRARFTMRFPSTDKYVKSLELPNFAFGIWREFVEDFQPITEWINLESYFDNEGNFISI